VAVTICFHVVWIIDFRRYIFCCFGLYIRALNYSVPYTVSQKTVPYGRLCHVSSRCCTPKLLNSANVSRSYSQNNTGTVFFRHGVYWRSLQFVFVSHITDDDDDDDDDDMAHVRGN